MLGTIGIIGNGSWGTALAKILTDNGHALHWWLRNTDAVQHLKHHRHNPHYLTSVSFAEGAVNPTDDLPAVWNACDTLVFAVPSAYALQVLETLPESAYRGKNIVSAIKGILPDHNQLLNDYLCEKAGLELDQYAAITGPCHAEEVAAERLSYLTFSGLNDRLAGGLAAAFRNRYIYTTHNHDVWGAQLAAVLKNIYAVGAGIAHSLDYGDNFLSVYVTACFREMHRFLGRHFLQVHPSDEQPDFMTSAYLGDLLVTCYSMHSRNRTFGAMIGKNYSVKAATLEMNMIAEGYFAARGMQAISAELAIPLPICDAIYSILWEGRPPRDTFAALQRTLS